jgi:2-methylcitrate dehydratase
MPALLVERSREERQTAAAAATKTVMLARDESASRRSSSEAFVRGDNPNLANWRSGRYAPACRRPLGLPPIRPAMHPESAAAAFDPLLVGIADYASQPAPRFSAAARSMAALCLMDALACLAPALNDPDCRRIIGPLVPGAVLPGGARVPGTGFELDPVRAAFSTGSLVRWLDFSDTTFDGGHPSDNLGALLACADYRDRRGGAVTMAQVLDAIVIAYEIQGRIAAACKFDAPAVGLDAVLAVKIAASAGAARLLGGSRDHILNAVSSAFADGATLNAYRQPPNSGTRKGWAGPRAAAIGVELALLAIGGEMGCPTVLTAKPWGFFEVMLGGRAIELPAPLGCGIVENIVFKLLPSQRNASTAAEAALQLHPAVAARVGEVEEVVVHTHAEALERIDNATLLHNAAARDHSLQFIVAAALAHGALTAAHYHEPLATDARVLELVRRVRLVEDARYSAGYKAPEERSTGNAVEAVFGDGSRTGRIEVLHPGGHPARRAALRPLLEAKFESLTRDLFPASKRGELRALFFDPERLAAMRASAFMQLLVPSPAA